MNSYASMPQPNPEYTVEDYWRYGGVDRYEYIEVDSQGNEISAVEGITGGNISRNALSELKYDGKLSYSFEINKGWLDKNIRVYLVRKPKVRPSYTIRENLGTFMTTTPGYSLNSDGSVGFEITMYSNLLRLKRRRTTVDYTIGKGANCVDTAKRMCETVGLKVVYEPSSVTLAGDNTWDKDTTWLSIVNDLLTQANYGSVDVDMYGNALLLPYKNPESQNPVWTFYDGEKGVYMPDINCEWDVFDTPNRITVFSSDNDQFRKVTVSNDDPEDPYSTVNRGVIDKVYDLDHLEEEPQLLAKANNYLLSAKQSVEAYKFRHLYVPVKHGDVVVFRNSKLAVDQVVTIHTMDISLQPGTPCDDRVRWFRNG